MIFVEVVFFLIYFAFCADGANWYLANDNSDTQKFNKNVAKLSISRDIPIEYTQLLADHAQRQVFVNDLSNNYEFKPSNPSNIASMPKSEQRFKQIRKIGIKSNNGPLELRNEIKNTNIFNINGPKIKKLRRRCPQNPRKAKVFISNATSEGRFLEVFEVVEFEHVSCSSNTGFEGHCLHEYDCHKSGGTSMGSCADGYGTCCVTLFNCEGRSSAPIGWFNNPGYPSPSTERLSCTFILDKFSKDIKQIRLDFTHFELLPPTVGNCELDQFVVTGQNVNTLIPILCGINTGQHVYIEVKDGPLILSIQTVTAENRLFSIKISQLTSSDDLAAPTGCLQFFKEDHGHIESFNYRERTEIGITRSPSYLNNLNYAVCISRATESCSVTYTNVGAMQIVNYDTDGLPVIPPQQAGVELLNCPSDWLLIAALRLCGERLNDASVIQDFSLDAPVTDDGAGPIVIWFRSDGVYTGRGFRINYQQNPCTT